MDFENESSPLSVMGYVVGEKGGTKWRRHKILETAIEELWRPPVRREIPKEQLDEWGEPGRDRYLKIDAKLRSQIENAKSRRDSSKYRDAIREWEEDLRWLREKY